MAQLQVTADRLNKRRIIPSVLPDTNNITGMLYRNDTFEGELAATNTLGSWYKDADNNYYWGNAVAVVTTTQPVATNTFLYPNLDLPLTRNLCIKCTAWMRQNFEDKFTTAVANTVFEKELLYAIACQETAINWYAWISDHTADEILARCVFDASGDVNGTRAAFPKNTTAFIQKYGQPIADMLIAEANATRALHGWAPKQWVYAGYGIFQYDLQSIITDPAFFEQKQWYSIDECLKRVIKELSMKWSEHSGDLFSTIKAYNGSGIHADNYAKNVSQFLAWIKGE